MKKFVYFLALFLVAQTILAQTPQMFKYQAVARDSEGTIMANSTVAVQVEILQGAADGSAVLSETHNTTTNNFGLLNLEIGSIETADMALINWANGPYFVRITINGTVMGTSQLLSVPFAEYAMSANNATTADNVFSGDYGDLTNTPAIPTSVSELINDANYITDPADNDNDDTNELQDLSLSGNTLSLSDDASTVDLSGYMDNTDAQDLSLTTNTLSLTNDATSVDLSGYLDNTDAQTLDLSGTTLSISNGNNVDLAAVQDGTGTDDQTLSEILGVNTSAGNNNISDLNDPVNDQDAATKAYVDALQAQIEQLQIGLANANDGEFLLSDTSGILVDVDGNVYNIIKIGTQWWMADNLRTRHFANGDPITDGTGMNTSGDITGKYYFVYNDNASMEEELGLLYSWAAFMNGGASDNGNPSTTQGVCPDGWHVPSLWDHSNLYNNYGGMDFAGDELRDTGTDHWIAPNTTATNESGFTAIGSGYRWTDNSYGGYHNVMYIWSSVEFPSDTDEAWVYQIDDNEDDINRYTRDKNTGAAVRCVKD
jgi:uncharacterized protein (TIGR02145 family)